MNFNESKPIIFGLATIPYCKSMKAWVLPGGTKTRNEDIAIKTAKKINKLIKSNR